MLTFYHDYTDPRSFLVELRLAAIGGFPPTRAGLARTARELPILHHPFELLPPGAPMGTGREPAFRAAWAELREEGERHGVIPRAPSGLPWTRKAHELVRLAIERDLGPEIHASLLLARHVGAEDVGRVDVLVRVATEAGIPTAEAKAALDVDRFTAEVSTLIGAAERSGVRGVPTLRDPAGCAVGTSVAELTRALRADV